MPFNLDANANANRSSRGSCKNGAADILREFIRWKELQWLEYNYNRDAHFNYPSKIDQNFYLSFMDLYIWSWRNFQDEISNISFLSAITKKKTSTLTKLHLQFNRTIKSSTPTTITITNKSPLNFSRRKSGQKTTIPIVPIYRPRPKKDPKKEEKREREEDTRKKRGTEKHLSKTILGGARSKPPFLSRGTAHSRIARRSRFYY